MMDKETRERFERIDQTLERVSDRMDRISEAHQDLEASQKNTDAAVRRFIDESRERGREVDERIANLTILVDRLVAKDLGKNGGS